MNEIEKAINTLLTVYNCNKLNYWPHECDKCTHTEKCYTSHGHLTAVELAIQVLKEKLEREKQPDGMISMKNRLPKKEDGGKSGYVLIAYDNDTFNVCYWDRVGHLKYVTHWQPLPEPSKEDN